MSAQVMLAQARDHGVQLTGPVPPDTSRQAMAGEGFDISAFTIDWHVHTATCPQGATAGSWREQQDSPGHDVIRIRFPDRTCAIRPVRAKCTRRTSGPRDLVVRPQAEHETLQRARHDQSTEEWKNHYHRRAGIEGTLSQAVRRPGLRRSRYPGLRKTGLQLLLTAAAIDLIRIDAWLTETPLARTRTAPLDALPEAA
ncbi:transposase [Streptomyces sp. 5-6(2022)]|uniref:transposase n=1 Tax=Streptomyces sp. 5-6(2022) TaxID=2936510 RepID=UPI0023B9E635|nr:transposase [Streptomyces sp. 5-6(2022)]